MAINVTSLLIGKTVAEREGVASQKAIQLGLLASFVSDNPLISFLVVRELARREAVPAPAPAEADSGCECTIPAAALADLAAAKKAADQALDDVKTLALRVAKLENTSSGGG